MKKVLFLILSLTLCCHPLIAQYNNNSLHFWSDDYVEINNIAQEVNGLSEFTVEFWVKFDAQLNTDYNTFYAVNTSDYGNRFLIRSSGPIDGVADATVIYINDGSNQYIVGSTPIGDNNCHHIAFTYDNGVCLLYVDGQLDASGNYTFEFQETDLHSLGQEYDMTPNPTSAFYNGEIDDFRIWDIAKPQAEINNNKDIELLGTEMNLLTYFNFNQGVSSGNNTMITNLNNIAQPSQNGKLFSFNLDGSSISNFIKGSCLKSVVNLNEYFVLNRIKVYPNPTNDFLNLSNIESISSITIRDNLGQVVLTTETSSLINISSLPKATYFIEITTYDNKRHVLNILKL